LLYSDRDLCANIDDLFPMQASDFYHEQLSRNDPADAAPTVSGPLRDVALLKSRHAGMLAGSTPLLN
jgi:hypothetical protein